MSEQKIFRDAGGQFIFTSAVPDKKALADYVDGETVSEFKLRIFGSDSVHLTFLGEPEIIHVGNRYSGKSLDEVRPARAEGISYLSAVYRAGGKAALDAVDTILSCGEGNKSVSRIESLFKLYGGSHVLVEKNDLQSAVDLIDSGDVSAARKFLVALASVVNEAESKAKFCNASSHDFNDLAFVERYEQLLNENYREIGWIDAEFERLFNVSIWNVVGKDYEEVFEDIGSAIEDFIALAKDKLADDQRVESEDFYGVKYAIKFSPEDFFSEWAGSNQVYKFIDDLAENYGVDPSDFYKSRVTVYPFNLIERLSELVRQYKHALLPVDVYENIELMFD